MATVDHRAVVHEAYPARTSTGRYCCLVSAFSLAAAAAVARDGSPTPARVPQPVYDVGECGWQGNEGKNANLMQGQERVKFHNGEVIAEQNERRHVNDILRSIPQVREQLGSTCSRKPDDIAQEDVPVERQVNTPGRRKNT